MKSMFFKKLSVIIALLVSSIFLWSSAKLESNRDSGAHAAVQTMQPGFNACEAITLLRLSYTADVLGGCLTANGKQKQGKEKKANKNCFNTNSDDPIPYDGTKRKPHASPYQPIWPKGWSYPPNATSWENAIFTTILGNTAILAYNKREKKYALAFAGTANLLNALEDLLAIMVTAGKWTLKTDGISLVVSNATYISGNYSSNKRAKIHLGFRLALESFNWKLEEAAELKKRLPELYRKYIGHLVYGKRLKEVIENLPDGSSLYVTGHSLGGALAGLCAAWLKAEGFLDKDKKNLDLKCYTFASPKVGNDYFASSMALALANGGILVRVANNLDTIPQVPFTIELPDDLNNPEMIALLIDQIPFIKPIVDFLFNKFKLPLTLDFRHIGVPFILNGKPPVVYKNEYFPCRYFPEGTNPVRVLEWEKQWWQHMPWTYLDLLSKY